MPYGAMKGRGESMPVNPYQKYKQQSVMTMTQGEMLVRLYDEIIKQCNGAIMYMEENNVAKTNEALLRSQRILTHLRSTLNFKYDIANNLDALYEYFNRRLVEANIHKDKKPIEEVIPMVTDLRDAYAQAERLSRT